MEFSALAGREGQHQYDEEEEEMVGDVATKNPMFSSCSSSSSSPSPSSIYSQYNKGLFPQPNMPRWEAQAYEQQQQQQRRQRLWLLGALEPEEEGTRSNEAAHGEKDPSFSQRLDLMDLYSHQSYSNPDADATGGNGGEGGSGPRSCRSSSSIMIEKEREHMFDKVVTPSDVGKLNRLVIPKQHAEKYFPLDSTTNEKGLLLNFEDRNGKPWRFRYSYWNSSQSYVITKGWSRFVKEKRLDAGDIVSFERGVGEDLDKDHLYIDWRRRPPDPARDPSSLLSSSSSSLLLPPLTPLGLSLRHALSLGPPPPSAPLPWSRLFLPTPNPTNPLNHMHFHHHHHRRSLNYDRTTHDHHHHHLLLQPHRSNPTTTNSSNSYSYSGIDEGDAAAAAGRMSSCGGYNHNNYNYNYNYNMVNPAAGLGPGSDFYLRSSSSAASQHDDNDVGVGVGVVVQEQGGDNGDVPMVIDSMPPVVVVHNGKAAAPKRVRLFGVNLDCPTTPEDDSYSEGDVLSSTFNYNTVLRTTTMSSSLSHDHHQLPPSSSLQLRAYSNAPIPMAPAQLPKNPNQSLSFDLDI